MEKNAAFKLLFVGASRQATDLSTIELRNPVVNLMYIGPCIIVIVEE